MCIRDRGTLVYGVDGNIDAIQAISEGKMTATAKQQPDQLAILSTKNMYRVLNGEEIDGGWPVSYTHLDVYKRQVMSRTGLPYEFVETPPTVDARELDVYKRQVSAGIPKR